MADVIDARSTDLNFTEAVGTTLRDEALDMGVAVLNGELAKYGPMMNCDLNMSATMLGSLPESSEYAREVRKNGSRIFEIDGTKYFVFAQGNNYGWLNSDSTGTKPLINGRFGAFNGSVDDALAMMLDDKGKFGGGALAAFTLAEANTLTFPFVDVVNYATARTSAMGVHSVMQPEFVGDRLVGPHGEKIVYSIGGSLVSLVDADITDKMPKPKEGDYLIAIKGNGRSNGYTDRRNLVASWLGNEWHLTDGGKWFGEFLIKPSIIFYPVFSQLIKEGLASFVTHMSGGAYDDKLAKLLARQGLYAEVGYKQDQRLYSPDPREAAIAAHFRLRDSHTKFPMGTEGFVASSRPEEAIRVLREKGLEAKIVARLERRPNIKGIKIMTASGDEVDFTEKIAA
jgi:phosphoribosylaminoimidazole (AIR) synthetase